MAYRVVHRPDGLLQRNNSRDYEEEGLANTFIGRYTAPAHQALERFIDECLALRAFETIEDLRSVLEEWPTFYREMHGNFPYKDWSHLQVDPGALRLQTSSYGPGGHFVFALIEEVEDDTSSMHAEEQLTHA